VVEPEELILSVEVKFKLPVIVAAPSIVKLALIVVSD